MVLAVYAVYPNPNYRQPGPVGLVGIALPGPVLVHLQNGVIREGTSGETSTIPLVGIPNGALHSQVREYPSKSRDEY